MCVLMLKRQNMCIPHVFPYGQLPSAYVGAPASNTYDIEYRVAACYIFKGD